MRISTEDFFNLIQLIQPLHILGKINPVFKNKTVLESCSMKTTVILLSLISFVTVFGITACSSDNNNATAAGGIQAYQKALVAKDLDQLINYSCADWEAQARLELESFGAVQAELRDLQCADAGQDGDATVVSCTGVISAAYGNEVLEINLADRQYMAVYESNEWRMCGYR